MQEIEYDGFIEFIFEEYRKRKQKENMYDKDINLFKNIIELYFSKNRQPYFKEIIEKYKSLYIFDETRIEPNVTIEEQQGLGEIYDFIKNFDFNKDYFNIFATSLMIHQKLYSKCAGAHSFGGKLRNTNVILKDLDIDVVDYNTAVKLFNMYLNPLVGNAIFKKLDDGDLFGYINDSIVLCSHLIKIQPFQDGNKRTFRALLNLLLKKANIPPIFIEPSERKEYKDALVKALTTDDYQDIVKFYYYKICDAIILLDLDKSMEKSSKSK